MQNFDEFLSEGETLRSISQYVVTYPEEHTDPDGRKTAVTMQMEIRVLKYLGGVRRSQFQAVPYAALVYGAEEFICPGDSEEEVLYEVLRRIKGVPFERIFPPE
jgi:hypothetical protein